MISQIRAGTSKLRREGVFEVLKDIFLFFPIGLSKTTFTTPEGVRLSLNDLSPVTVGRIRTGAAEQPEKEVLQSIPDGIPVLELGAGTGYISSLVNRSAGSPHIVVEPNPVAFDILQSTKQLNDVSFDILNKAYHPTKDQVKFPQSKFYKTGSLYDDHSEKVTIESLSIRDIISEFQEEEWIIHIDIEGAEDLLLESEMDIIRNYCVGIFIEFHPEYLGEKQNIFEKNLKNEFNEVKAAGNVKLYLSEDLE